jgi:hypothetical protein
VIAELFFDLIGSAVAVSLLLILLCVGVWCFCFLYRFVFLMSREAHRAMADLRRDFL